MRVLCCATWFDMKSFSRVTKSAYELGEECLTNEALCALFGEKKIDAISKLSGIESRRIASKNTTSVDLAYRACLKLFDGDSSKKQQVDSLIFVTQTPDYKTPANAFVLHQKLGLNEKCMAFDMSLGCSAFPYVLSVANSLIVSGQAKCVLIALSDTVSKMIYEKDHSLRTIHGDGAAVFLVEKSENQGFEFADFCSDSSGLEYIMAKDSGFRNPPSQSSKIEKINDAGICSTDESLQMNGAAVFFFSISKVPSFIKECLKNRGVEISEYDKILLHQANATIVSTVYKTIGAQDSQKYEYLKDVGNLSLASSAVLLARAMEDGAVKQGDRVLLVAFGVGLSIGLASFIV